MIMRKFPGAMAPRLPAAPQPTLAWCAGFFDGDGCVSITRQQVPDRKNPTFRLRLTLVQNCVETLQAFQRGVAEASFITSQGPRVEHNRQVYSLIYEGRHALRALQKMEPHLIRKRTSALAAHAFWEEGRMGVCPGPKGFGPEVWAARTYWFSKLKRMK
jgi:hypothetical protein